MSCLFPLAPVSDSYSSGNQFNCVLLFLLVPAPGYNNQEDDDHKEKRNDPEDDDDGYDESSSFLFHHCHALLARFETPGDITVVPGVAKTSVAPH